MLRGIAFYGGGGGALTFFDPVQGAAITEIPTIGESRKAIFMGAIAYGITPTKREFVNITIGSDGDYHDIQILGRGDGDNLSQGMGASFMHDLGDFEVSEGMAIAGTSLATGQTSGVLYYDDNEPEVSIPKVGQSF